LYCIDSEYDASNVLHRISEHKLSEMPYCSKRPYMLADTIDYVPDDANVSVTRGSKTNSQYLKFNPLEERNIETKWVLAKSKLEFEHARQHTDNWHVHDQSNRCDSKSVCR
jgi:hypothetical protein